MVIGDAADEVEHLEGGRKPETRRCAVWFQVQDPDAAKAGRNLEKVREELADESEPAESSIFKWLETAKNVLAAEAITNLWHLFGI